MTNSNPSTDRNKSKAAAEFVGFFVVTIGVILLMLVCPFAFMRPVKTNADESTVAQPLSSGKKIRTTTFAVAGALN